MNKIKLILILLLLFILNICAYANEALPYNYSDTFSIPVRLSVVNEISTKGGLIEGQEIKLKLKNDIFYKHRIIARRNDIATAKIETYITKGMNGFPAEIILDSFNINGIKDSQLLGTYTKTGKNFAPLVYPIKWALTPIPLAGTVTNLITGTNATISPEDEIIIYYFPNWK